MVVVRGYLVEVFVVIKRSGDVVVTIGGALMRALKGIDRLLLVASLLRWVSAFMFLDLVALSWVIIIVFS